MVYFEVKQWRSHFVATAFNIRNCLKCREEAELSTAWAWLYCYFLPPTSSQGGLVSGERKGEHSPGSARFCLLLSSRQVVRICPVDSILCHKCPSPTCSSETWLQDVLKRGTGEESTAWNQEVEASLSPAESNLSRKEPTWAEGSQAEPGRAVKSRDTSAGNSCVESSPASKAAAWWDVDSLAFGDLSVTVFCCLGLRDRESQLQEVATILSWSQLPHGTKLRWWTPSLCKAPSLLHTFVLNIAAVTVYFLFHCFVLPINCYLNP